MASLVVADTSAWIELFRGSGAPVVRALKARLRDGRLATTGLITLELLAGARSKRDLANIRRFLAVTVPLRTEEADYEEAGLLTFRLRRKGITVHAADALIAAVCIRSGASLLTVDPDFGAFATHEGLDLVTA